VDSSIRWQQLWPPIRGMSRLSVLAARLRQESSDRSAWLARVIDKIKPDIVHSLEMQHSAYLTLAARTKIGNNFPTWVVSNWGSDIYLFGRLQEHARKIREVLSVSDYYFCECHRDVELARDFGFTGEVLPVLPNGGGYDVEHIRNWQQPGPSSARRLILLKGYQNWAGRALVGLRAIELCSDLLKGYRIAIYMANPEGDVALAAALLSAKTGIPIDLIPPSSHDDMLRLQGRARVSIGLSISDAISTSALEAMIMGSFPIQSNTSCLCEWVRHGETGLLVHPESPEEIAEVLRPALVDDEMIDHAAAINAQVAHERLRTAIIQPQVVEMYKSIKERSS
jgi:glycosyltransferase involved in cell wall biosynthesis